MKVVWLSSSRREDLLHMSYINPLIVRFLFFQYQASLHIEHIPQNIIQRLSYVKKYNNQILNYDSSKEK